MPVHVLHRVTLTYFDLDANTRLNEGDEFTIQGERGQFKFISHVVSVKGEWIEAFGGPSKGGQFRSFRPERIKKKKVSRT